MNRHIWVRGGTRSERAAVTARLELPAPLLQPVDAYRRLRGPYTAAGSIVRGLEDWVLAAAPALVRRHEVELLTVAPELRRSVPASRETLTSLAVPKERTRFYSRLRTLRLAHGLVEFLRDLPVQGRVSLVIENLDHADPTDAEFVAVLLRRIDPNRLLVAVGTNAVDLADGPLATALAGYAEPMDMPGGSAGTIVGPPRPDGAARFVQGDGVSDDPGLLAAYQSSSPAERAHLHDLRADALQANGSPSWSLGAIPYHRERGSDPAAAADAVRAALDYCIDLGFYDATVDLGVRGRAIVDLSSDPDHWWAFTTKMTTSLAALGRSKEAEALYDEARATTTNPTVHVQAAYATAMLYTRHHDADQRNDLRALGWINEAIALSSLHPDPRERAFRVVFNRNGLALIKVHLGELQEALDLVDGGLAELDRQLDHDEYRLHRSVLRYNRGQVYAALGRPDEALADYTAVIDEDPNYPEYHFERGNLLRRLSRNDEALSDYETAIRLSPPFPEVYYNRADLKYTIGDDAGALADFGYVIELDPEYLDAYVNRAGLLIGLRRFDEAHRDVLAGLRIDPRSAHLHCLLGQLATADGDMETARAAFGDAIEADSTLQAAWAGRASLAFEEGDLSGALGDLDRAMELGDSADLRANRAIVLAALGQWAAALSEIDLALTAEPDDPELHRHREELLARRVAA